MAVKHSCPTCGYRQVGVSGLRSCICCRSMYTMEESEPPQEPRLETSVEWAIRTGLTASRYVDITRAINASKLS